MAEAPKIHQSAVNDVLILPSKSPGHVDLSCRCGEQLGSGLGGFTLGQVGQLWTEHVVGIIA